MKAIYITTGFIVLLLGCQQQEQSDAYGNFEATEITISAEVPGKIMRLDLVEGDVLKVGQPLGYIDTTQLHLQKQELLANLSAVSSRKPGIAAQMQVLRQQKANAERELQRFRALAKNAAATQKQVDDLKDQVAVLERQVQSIATQNDPIIGEIGVIEAKIARIENQLQKASITAPMAATVLTKIAQPYEMVNAGSPLFRIADLSHPILRVYVSGTQLPSVKLGQEVQVLVDKNAEENRALSGKVVWIANTAEFTPKTVQTKEERVDLVYAVKVRVTNDGLLKIGMPGEVNFTTTTTPQTSYTK